MSTSITSKVRVDFRGNIFVQVLLLQPPTPRPLPTLKSLYARTNFVTIQLKPFYTELKVALIFCCLLLLLLMLLLFCFLKLSFYNRPHS